MPQTTTTANVLGLRLASPVIVGSGLLTDQERNIRRLLAAGAGAVVTKTIHPDPPRDLDERIVRLPTGMLNSTTYSKRPVAVWLETLRSLAEDGLPVIASVHANDPHALGVLAERVSGTGCRALELGISCLNEDGGLHDTADRVRAYTEAVRGRTSLPISVKLAAGEGLEARARAAEDAGADAITLSDSISGADVLAAGGLNLGGVFGYSGPGIKPLVLAAVYALRRRGFELPILGCGGVSDGADVLAYLSVGSQAVQVYTALHTDMIATLDRILRETASLLAADENALPFIVGRALRKSS
ncbi:hypothetical protein [Nonomuraea sp. JJY05]|jgi:dihydroorotate dehydrogenase (fumarate)/dihydroorotate dehydrogenase (NAD+) catalytic subunit|uniref:hypothetical protein n=1 Tax=Nonomuraea sp. JJY05 TaxID=3350255 RepID=UPI00373EEF67